MNLVKSLFIMLTPIWLLIALYQGIKGLMYTEYTYIFFGVILSALPLLIFLSFIMLFRSLPRTSLHLLSVSTPSFLGYVLTFAFFLKNSNYDTIDAMIYSMSAFLLTLLYIYWYSQNGRKESEIIEKGSELPKFYVFDGDGEKINSAAIKGKSIVFFHRGNWCPLCMAQINEVVKQYKKFAEKNISLIFIAPQSEKNSEALAKKHGLDFKFYSDKNNKAAKKLGLVHKFGLPMGFQTLGYKTDSVYPTVIAIDENSSIIYSNQTNNYRLRPEINELLEVFDR